MRLWTIQNIGAYKELKEAKELKGKSEFVYEDFRYAYNWMIKQMGKRLNVPSPDSLAYPIWSWYQWRGVNKRKPDLRYSGHSERGEKLVRIEFEIEEDKVLLSDFDLFHYVINYWYLPSSEHDSKQFDKEMARSGITLYDLQDCTQKSAILIILRKKVEESWNKIFNLDWEEEYITANREEKSIQGVLWELKWEQIINVDEFIAR